MAVIAAPLNALLRKRQSFDLHNFYEKQYRAFQALKRALMSPPVWALPRTSLLFTVDTDTCEYHVGCALIQTQEDSRRHPIGYWSRSLDDAERN